KRESRGIGSPRGQEYKGAMPAKRKGSVKFSRPSEVDPVEDAVMGNMKRTFATFKGGEGAPIPPVEAATRIKVAAKMTSYPKAAADKATEDEGKDAAVGRIIHRVQEDKQARKHKAVEDREGKGKQGTLVLFNSSAATVGGQGAKHEHGNALVVSRKAAAAVPEPEWHCPWKLQSVVSGHVGWVRSIAFDPGNEWFVTGSADRTIKVWDLAKCCAGAEGGLKLTLTGHINAIRGLAVSPRHPYMFSAAEDKKVLCWDLEYNQVIRSYHGHLSGVFSLALHPTLDVLISGGRDSVARVWDMRTKRQIHCLSGHTNAVAAIETNAVDPQVITGAMDNTIKLWDMVAGKVMTTLTHHKKAVRALTMGHQDFSFVSAAADNMKKWQARDGMFLNNISGHRTIINALDCNEDGVLASGGDNGTICLWDYATGHCFQRLETIVQPGSLDSEAGIFAMKYDMSGSRLVTCEADKTIKIWKPDEEATPDSHPVDMR
ncbi:unnamed protein product, partial [Chrysoparadoxa australica]